jgi:hypothetical protein
LLFSRFCGPNRRGAEAQEACPFAGRRPSQHRREPAEDVMKKFFGVLHRGAGSGKDTSCKEQELRRRYRKKCQTL